MELLPFVDILKVFNNPIIEEQAWAVCYQCVHFLSRNQNQEYYQVVFDYGIHSIWLSRQGDVLLKKRPPDPNGSGIGPPNNQLSPQSSSLSTTILSKRKRHVIATETDAVQALGTAIFEALDYGIDASEERQLSQGLEALIVTMTNADNSLEYDPDTLNADDEGIEKDADIEHRCTVQDVIKLCSQHLSSKQDAQQHYKAVCRALATEAGELFTFLEKISTCKEKLSETRDDDARNLEELRRADWACLWVQVMRSLRQGVHLKKVAHTSLPPLECELTPFEILLEDIRSRRYTLHKIMVDGEIPHNVKNDAHAVILDFIRSRPPLKKVNDRKLKPKQPPTPDPHERLLKEIRSRPRLRPVKQGKLVVEKPVSRQVSEEGLEPSQPTKRVIKPDLNLLLNNSFEESSEDDDHSSPSSSTLTPVTSMTPPMSSWQKPVARDAFLQDSSSLRPTRLQRRHTIMVCESSTDGKVVPQELPPLEEEEEPSPVRESHNFSHQSVSRQAQGLTVLHRTSYSDNDLSSQVLLRNHPQGHLKRSSLEHRRSLTSLTTELCAIPEMEDGPGGTDSPTKSSGTLMRSWSHEQAPPPNPSPPCKGRARAALGLSMTGMKSVGGPYHPAAHRLHTSQSSTLTGHNSSASSDTSSGIMDYGHSSLLACHSQQVMPPSNYVLSTSSTTSLPASSPLSSRSANLDPTVSSQSPGYSRKILMSQSPVQSGASSSRNIGFESRTERWSQPRARRERFSSKRQQYENKTDDVFDNDLSLSGSHNSLLSKKEIQPRRLSLESGVGMYSDSSNTSSESVDCDRVDKVSRRLSLGRRGRERVDGALGRMKSPEETERLNRWRMLQEEDLATRTRKMGKDMTNQQCAFTAEHIPQQQLKQHNNRGFSQQVHSSQKMDIFQQKLADEEARFARWRHLEETGTHPDENISHLSSNDKEYVDEMLSTRLQPVVPTNSVVTSDSTSPPLHVLLPLPKRWQNPVECLSLTLEEVTHIRSVLTKAELESLISHPDLYQQVSKSKLCFTCKTTRFTLFGEWGTKCKFCKRTVCSKCLRKMNVPADELKNIPMYTLSPTLTPEVQELVQNFIRTASVKPTPDTISKRNQTSNLPQNQQEQISQPTEAVAPSVADVTKSSKGFFSRSKPLQRSHSLFVHGQKHGSAAPWIIKGPSITICCDCKGMVKEIIRATQASLALLSAPGSSAAVSASNAHHASMSRNFTRN